LHFASMYGHPSVVKTLLEGGADVTAKTDVGAACCWRRRGGWCRWRRRGGSVPACHERAKT